MLDVVLEDLTAIGFILDLVAWLAQPTKLSTAAETSNNLTVFFMI
jgi:hypothetical protein